MGMTKKPRRKKENDRSNYSFGGIVKSPMESNQYYFGGLKVKKVQEAFLHGAAILAY